MDSFSPIPAIIDGISKKLNKFFGDSFTIYTESVKQGLKRPCFFIKLLKPTNTKERGEVYSRENGFCIHYFPESTNEPKTKCYKMLDNLYVALEYIEVNGNLVRGTGMLGDLHDGTLQFHVYYNVFVHRLHDPEKMEVLEPIDFRTKG